VDGDQVVELCFLAWSAGVEQAGWSISVLYRIEILAIMPNRVEILSSEIC
jgi:hypothetical protein